MKKNLILLLVMAVLLAMTVWFFRNQRDSTLEKESADFAYADTASITRIFLADKFNHSVLLERTPQGWTANGKPALQPSVNFLLDAIKNIEVRHPVAKAAYNNIMKQMAATGIKTEIYVGDKKVRTYYVGHETQDQMGTYMYMEGSSAPFAVHVPGFNGILNIRYNTNERNWIAKNVFRFLPEEIKRITVINNLIPAKSFEIRQERDGSFNLHAYPSGELISQAVKEKILNYVNEYREINYERKPEKTDEWVQDSIRNAGPFMEITLETNDSRIRQVKLYRKPRPVSEDDEWLKSTDPFWRSYDPDRLYFERNDEPGFFVGQYFTFRRLMKIPEDFFMGSR